MAGADVLGSSSALLLLFALQLLRPPLVYSQTHGDIRLAGYGASSVAGRLEVYYDGEWGTVCWDEFFELISASVACRQLGLGPAVHVVHYPELRYDIGSGPIHLTSVHCQGAESHILRCQHNTYTESCEHYLDVGIECSTSFFPYSGQVRLYTDPATTATTMSSFSSSGLLQMFLEGQWANVCGNSVTFDDTIRVCQQLGFTGVEDYTEKEIAPSGSWVEKNATAPECSNSSESLPCFSKCFAPVAGPCSVGTGTGLVIQCEFDMDAVDQFPSGNSSTCEVDTPSSHLDVKMASVVDECDDPPCNSYQGVPKVFFEGEWQRVCHGNLSNGDVICRQLGFSIAVRYPLSSAVGTGIKLECNGMETHLSECSPPTKQDLCDLISLRCGNGDVPYGSLKLANSSGSSGVLLIYDQTFLPLCDSGFSMTEATVACRQLGYAGVLEVVPNSLFVVDEGTVGEGFYSSVSCSGDEEYLLDCDHIPVDTSVCRLPYDTIGVQCRTADYQEGMIRMEGGGDGDESMSGRLQVNIDGTWGSVCSVEFDQLDAHVACRQLGYATVDTFSRDTSPITSLPISIYSIGCSGFEESLLSCPHTVSNVNSSCSHDDDVFLHCAADLPQQDFEVRLSNESHSSSPLSVSGRLEVVVHGLWMSVCGTFFTQEEAVVACRNLGFTNASSFCTDACYGSGNDYIFFSDSHCAGDEDTLAECFNEDEDVHNDEFCSHSSDVGLICVMDDPAATTGSPSSVPVTSPVPDSATPFYNPLSTVEFYGLVVGSTLALVLVLLACICVCTCLCKKNSKKKVSAATVAGTIDDMGPVEVTSVNGVGPDRSSKNYSYANIHGSLACKEKEAELTSQWPVNGDRAGATPRTQPTTVLSRAAGISLRPTSSVMEKEDLCVETSPAVTTTVCLEVECGHLRSRDSLGSASPPPYDELEFTSYPTHSRTVHHASD